MDASTSQFTVWHVFRFPGFIKSLSARRAAEQLSDLTNARRTAEEEALSTAHKQVSSTLERAGRIPANASQFDSANQLLQRSRSEANAKTFDLTHSNERGDWPAKRKRLLTSR